MDGGVERGIITEFFGEGGSGKTNVCLQFTKQCVLEGKKVIFIDTEGLSSQRMNQVFYGKREEITKEILLFKPFSLDEQKETLAKAKRLVGKLDIGLVIIDSLTVFYRERSRGDGRKGKRYRRRLAEMLVDGITLARRHNIPVIVTNQVYTDIENDRLMPIGGHIINHNAKTIVQIEKLPEGRRRATLLKHRSLESGRYAYFKIGEAGLIEDDLIPMSEEILELE